MNLFKFDYSTNSVEVQEKQQQTELSSELLESLNSKISYFAGDKDTNESDIDRSEKTFNAFRLNLDEARAEYEGALRIKKNEGIKKAKKDQHEIATAAAKTVKGRGYGNKDVSDEDDGEEAPTSKKTFTDTPELSTLFGMKAPSLPHGVEPKLVKGKDAHGDYDDDNQHVDSTAAHSPGHNGQPASVADPLSMRAELIHSQLTGASRAILGLPHIISALRHGMSDNAVIMMSRSAVGRKKLRSMHEGVENMSEEKCGCESGCKCKKCSKKEKVESHYSDDWDVQVIKEGNMHKFIIKDEDDIIAEGVALTYIGAVQGAIRKSELLVDQINERVKKLEEQAEHENGKYDRVLSIVKSMLNK